MYYLDYNGKQFSNIFAFKLEDVSGATVELEASFFCGFWRNLASSWAASWEACL